MRMYANDADGLPHEKKLIESDLSYKINGILFRVHNRLGRFCNEKQYCDAIEEELKLEGISYEREKTLERLFPGERTGRNRVDFYIADKIVVEVKAKNFFTKEDYFQMRRYLTALNIKLGLLVNFRQKVLHPKRILNTDLPP